MVRLALILCAGNHDRPFQAVNSNGGSQDSKRESPGKVCVYFTSNGLVGMHVTVHSSLIYKGWEDAITKGEGEFTAFCELPKTTL